MPNVTETAGRKNDFLVFADYQLGGRRTSGKSFFARTDWGLAANYSKRNRYAKSWFKLKKTNSL